MGGKLEKKREVEREGEREKALSQRTWRSESELSNPKKASSFPYGECNGHDLICCDMGNLRRSGKQTRRAREEVAHFRFCKSLLSKTRCRAYMGLSRGFTECEY